MLSKLYLTYLFLEAKEVLLSKVVGERPVAPEVVDERLTRTQRGLIRRARFRDNVAGGIDRIFKERDFESIDEYLRLFQAILTGWGDVVAANGGKLHVVILPMRGYSAIRPFIPDELPVLDLGEELAKLIPDFDVSKIRFKNDSHWDERGNMYAAIAIYQLLRREHGLEDEPMADVVRKLVPYYSAFHPTFFPAGLQRTDTTPKQRDAIVSRYLSLEP